MKVVVLAITAFLGASLLWSIYLVTKYQALARADVDLRLQAIPHGEGVSPPEGKLETSFNSFTARLNNVGARNCFEVKPENRDIVILLGDSFTFGWGLECEGTVAHQLNLLDPHKRYLNLGIPGANLQESMAHYRQSYPRLPAPRAVVLQTILRDDIYNVEPIDSEIWRTRIEADLRWLPYPANLVLTMDRLLESMRVVRGEAVLADLTANRFSVFIRQPLEQLKRLLGPHKTPVLILHMDDPDELGSYGQWLDELCAKLGFDQLVVGRVISHDSLSSRLPDGHPSGTMNRAVASAVYKRLNQAPPAPSANR